MATFYGGEQLLEIKKVNVTTTDNVDEIGRVIYTVPTGRIAHIQYYATSRVPIAVSYEFVYYFKDPEININSPERIVSSSAGGGLPSQSHPILPQSDEYNNDNRSGFFDSGTQLLCDHNFSNPSSGVRNWSVWFLVHEYAKP